MSVSVIPDTPPIDDAEPRAPALGADSAETSERVPPDGRTRALGDIALLGLLAAASVVAVAGAGPLRPFIVFAAICLVPGGAILTRLATGEAITHLALAIGLSLALVIAGSLALAWSGWWHPEALGVTLGAASGLLLGHDLWRRRRALDLRLARSAPSIARRPSGRTAIATFAALAPVVAGLVAWGVSLRTIPTSALGKYGLPPALPTLWYAALAVLVGGAVIAIWAAKRPSTPVIALYVLAVVIVLYATVPAITAVPHYPWVYKHIGVTRFIGAHGGVNLTGDIYNRWPGFFAAAAVFSRLASADPLSFAAWAEPFFAAIDALLLGAIALAVARDKRVAGFAALTFSLGNWIGQEYFSPQSAAYTLAFALLLVFIRAFTGGEIAPRITRLMERVVRRPQPPIALSTAMPWPRTASIAAVLGLDAVIVATHQLTPYVLLFELGALALLGVARPRWLVVGMGVLTFAYLLPNVPFLAHNFGLFSGLNPASNIQHGNTTPVGLDFFHANAGGLLSLVLVALMFASALRLARIGEGAIALPLTVLALAPFGILFAQNYGGEASLRVFLFSSPWREVLIALGIATIARPRVRLAAALGTCLVLTYMFIPAFYGAENLNIIPRGEVLASEQYYAHAPAGSVLLLSAPDFPTWVGSRYTLMRGPLADDGPNLVGTTSFQDRPLGAADIPAVISVIHQYSRSGFVVFSTTGYRYAATHDLTPAGALESLERAIATSPYFYLWYSAPDARIYRLRG